MIQLLRQPLPKTGGIPAIPIKAAMPFARCKRGAYVHRIRSANYHQYKNMHGQIETWVSARCWCGMTLLLSKRRKAIFITSPEQGDVVCATCEGRAIGSGLFGSPTIAGQPVRFSPRAKP